MEKLASAKLVTLAGALLTAAGALEQDHLESAYEILRQARDGLDEVIDAVARLLAREQVPSGAAEDLEEGYAREPKPPERLYPTVPRLLGGEWA